MVVYDVTDRDSFHHARGWLQEIEKYAKPGTCRMLIGNKCDLTTKRAVSRDEGQELADELGLHFFETSARDSHNIEQSFQILAKEVLTRNIRDMPPSRPQPSVRLDGLRLGGDARGGCCR